MEAPDLSSADYWESEANDIRLNPAANLDTSGLSKALKERGITSSIVLATSGTSGHPRLIVLGKTAMLCSAEAVNQWCGITRDDIWLGGLSTFHVGGLGIYSRAFLTGSKVHSMAWNQWTRDGVAFLEALRDSTVTSLTPVHLYDLVEARVECPASLRGVFVGGGALSGKLAESAMDLGWPLWTTYGMTEASSQVATSLTGDTNWLPILPHWETQISREGILMIRGAALMRGSFSRTTEGTWKWSDSTDEKGFYTTGDRVEIHDGKLRPLGRADDHVKVLGELVSLAKVEASLSQYLGVPAVVLAAPDERRGAKLIASIESESDLNDPFVEWNESMPPYEQISEIGYVKEFPRTEVGKIDRAKLRHHREDLRTEPANEKSGDSHDCEHHGKGL